jgi:hypothetical protein
MNEQQRKQATEARQRRQRIADAVERMRVAEARERAAFDRCDPLMGRPLTEAWTAGLIEDVKQGHAENAYRIAQVAKRAKVQDAATPDPYFAEKSAEHQRAMAKLKLRAAKAPASRRPAATATPSRAAIKMSPHLARFGIDSETRTRVTNQLDSLKPGDVLKLPGKRELYVKRDGSGFELRDLSGPAVRVSSITAHGVDGWIGSR